jgi:hypothetical protein
MPPYESTPAGSRGPQSQSGSTQGQSKTWIALAAGVALGLILGLIIGWVVWPVQWTNAWPSDLSPEARAQYLAAVAEAYVYYGDQQAAEIARNRLYGLNDNLAEEIAAAQTFFADNPTAGSRLFVNNLGQLAQGLGIDSPDIVVDSPPVAEEVAPAEVTPAPAEPDVGNSVRTWVNWTLMLLAAVLLIGGGLYVIARLSRQRTANGGVDYVEEEADGFDDEEVAGAPGRNPYQRPVGSPLPAAAAADVPPARNQTATVYETPHGEDYGFDDEGFDDEHFAGEHFEGEEDEELEAYGQGVAVDTLEQPAYGATQLAEDEAFDDELSPPDDEDLDALDDRGAEGGTVYRAAHDKQDYDEQDYDDEVGDDYDAEATEGDYDSLEQPASMTVAPLAAVDAPAAQSAAPATDRPASRAGQGTVLKTFTVHYQTGIPDYDQSYSIMDPESGRYIGECGMGVNLKNGILQNNPDNVIALDVWLVDKKQEKSYSSQSRVLFSEYVIDAKLESAFTRERPNDAAPLVPQTGTSFQLKGPNLTLDCIVAEAVYAKNGPASGIFQSVKVDMTVRSND